MPPRKALHPVPATRPALAGERGLPAEFDIGERLREIRERYGLSQRALATRADVTNGMISMIEKNRTSPSVATLKKILNGFPMSLAEFFAVGQVEQPKIFFSADELVEIAGGPISYRQVGAHLQGKGLQVIHERLMPGADTGADMLRHEAEESGIVIRGEMELTVGLQTRILRAGDAYYFDSRVPHRFRNLSTKPCEVVSACTPPSF
jgi:transcriptional regulator with XRE-family HTH domain